MERDSFMSSLKHFWNSAFLLLACVIVTCAQSNFVPTQSVQFLSMDPPHPQVQFSDDPMLYLLDAGFVVSGLDSRTTTLAEEDQDQAPNVTLKPYFYPNPFRLSEGSELGYGLTDDLDIEIRFYNMLAQEIYRESYAAGTMGGLGSHEGQVYNKIPFSPTNWGQPGQAYDDVFGSYRLPSGVYFFVLIHNDEVIGKGKFAVKPE